jgi:hypothetical protein
MSVRIEFYAVDLDPFEQFLGKSLGEILKFAAENSDEDGHVSFSMDVGSYYTASSRLGILKHDQGRVEMSTTDIDRDPSLSVSCHDHLSTRGYTTELNLLLRVLADCSMVPWVHALSKDYRRWWIGSLLDWVQRANVLSADDYADYEILFLKVLRGSTCGVSLTGLQIQLSDLDFPIIPRFDNGGGRLGVWTGEDVNVFLRCTRHILSCDPQFGAPPDRRPVSTTAADGAEWNDWVHKMLSQLLAIEGLSYSTPSMVSMIG